MLGNMFGNFQEKQEEIQKQLQDIRVEAISQDGAVKVVVNGNKQIIDLELDPEKLDFEDHDQLQDLILVTTNEALDKAQLKAAEFTQEAVKQMLPPGFDNLFG